MSPNPKSTFWPSPSRYWLADLCGHAWAVNGPKWPKRNYEPSDDARHGNGVSLLGMMIGVWGREALALLPEILEHEDVALTGPAQKQKLKDCGEHLADYYESRAVTWRACELPLVLDMGTGEARAVEREVARRPPSNHVGAILDLVEIEDGLLVVTDFKSGYQQAQKLDVRTDPQLRAYVLCAARYAFAAGLVFRGILLRVAHVSDDAPVRVDEVEVDRLELGVVKNEMRARFERLPAATTPVVGQHCKRCPVFTACPAIVAGVEHAVQKMNRLPIARDVRDIVNADHAGYTRNLGKFLEEEGKRLQAMAKAWVLDPEGNNGKPIDIAPGLLYGPTRRNGTESVHLEMKGAIDIVQKHLGTGGGWNQGVSFIATKTSLERGAKARAAELALEKGDGKRVTAKSVYAPLYDELRASGAMRQGAPTEVVTEFPKRVEGEAES